MPLVVYLLGLGIFAQGTSEFMLSGLLGDIASDLDVSIPDAGLLISAFAVGMMLGAPILAVATLKLPRRTTLVAFQAVFIAGHVVGALAPGYGVLIATRVVTAAAYAGFWAVASVTALSLVPADAKARAMAVVASGLSLATVLGVPAGTLLSQHAGWRAAFWAVAALTALSVIGVLATVPAGRDSAAPLPELRTELRVFARPHLWVAYASTAFSVGASIAVFAYLGTLLTEVSGLPESWVPAVLALYGLGALIGLTIGGRTADAAPFRTLLTGLAGTLVTGAAVALSARSTTAVVLLTFVLGVFAFLSNPAVNARVYTILGETRTIGGAVNTSAFNVGITTAPWIAGLVIEADYGLAATGWVGAAFAAAGIGTTLADAALQRRADAAPPAAHTVRTAEPEPARV
jgi:DHA1 family chloramphenicol resistance protein-like MFS transporter